MKINILGTAVTKFGELWSDSPRSLAKEVITKAINDSNIRLKQIDALFVGNMLSGILGNQANLGSLFAEELGIYGFKRELIAFTLSCGLISILLWQALLIYLLLNFLKISKK